MTLPDAKSIKRVQTSCGGGGGGGGGMRCTSLYSTAPTTEKVGPRELSLRNVQYYRCIVLALMVGESYIRCFFPLLHEAISRRIKISSIPNMLICVFATGSTSVF
jgi:hypothetical protein